jgi:Flp pilus assembly protein TadD
VSNAGTKIGSLLAAALLMLGSMTISGTAIAMDEQVCDAAADLSLGAGDYRTAIALHSKILHSENNNALAHYHLGFAYGMVGRVAEEIDEYRRAISLGFNKWDLFLNLGLAYYEHHEAGNATTALETAVSLGPDHAETHFNLAVIYERQGRLDEALQQIIAALVLAPEDLDAANTDAIICAKMGHLTFARTIWTQLIETTPDYAPARINLAILNRMCGSNSGLCLDLRNTDHLTPAKGGR